MGNTQVLCFLILFAEDVDPDKVLRRYQWSRSGGQGLCERYPRCIPSAPSVWHARCGYANFSRCSFLFLRNSSEHPSGYIGGQNGDAICAVPRKTELRTWSTSHLLSSVDPVLYCDTNVPTHAPNCFIICFIGCFSVRFFLLRLGHCGLCAASSCFTERCIHCLCTTLAAALLFVSFIMFYSCFDLVNSGEQCN
jgi:hypothetical protein